MCDFFTNPCKRIIIAPLTVNNTLAIPVLIFERTSQSPRSILRIKGIPNGQPYCAVFISSPIYYDLHEAGFSAIHEQAHSLLRFCRILHRELVRHHRPCSQDECTIIDTLVKGLWMRCLYLIGWRQKSSRKSRAFCILLWCTAIYSSITFFTLCK